MSAFTFSFSGEDIEDCSTPDDHLDPNPQTSQDMVSKGRRCAHNSAFPIPGQAALKPQVHPLSTLLSKLPSRISYSTLHVPLGDGSSISIPRRELWDVRLQLMAEDDEDSLGNLAKVDVKTGVYEGGFKLWESSGDVVNVLSERGNSLLTGKCGIIELGCGTALPSLFGFQLLLHTSPKALQKTNLALADYNPTVLQLVTLPNLILSWAYVQSESWEEEGELEIDENTVERFLKSLETHHTILSFFSGGWGPEFIRLVAQNIESDLDQCIIIGAETIYSPFALKSFTETLLGLLKVISGKKKTSLVAAKKVYFGVGGSIEDFYALVEKNGGIIELVQEESDGVKRVVVEVQTPEAGIDAYMYGHSLSTQLAIR
ncbi:unnamed protein product [Blumeria hordei]|uniref:protein-histidine N-methyltransferase n=2 Tax=Blumeria hordei TaxID=2867405 RepID=A0A383V0S2_BLUHO|nr:methyl transferase [Blumeria hordei DH14]SZF05727.1 unnamed protein product [Blumeria hordei]